MGCKKEKVEPYQCVMMAVTKEAEGTRLQDQVIGGLDRLQGAPMVKRRVEGAPHRIGSGR